MVEVKKCKICGYRMTKLYLHYNCKRAGFPKWIPMYWYCVDCDKVNYKIDKYDLSGWVNDTRKLYRRSNRKNEPNWVQVAYYNGEKDKITSFIKS